MKMRYVYADKRGERRDTPLVMCCSSPSVIRRLQQTQRRQTREPKGTENCRHSGRYKLNNRRPTQVFAVRVPSWKCMFLK